MSTLLQSICRTLAATFLLSTAIPSASGEPRVWTSKDGRTLQAEFVRTKDSRVTVRKSDGREVDIPFSQLSDDDKIQALDLGKAFVEKLKNEQQAKEESQKRSKFLNGPLTYQLSGGSENWPEDRKKRIVAAMDAAVSFYNEHAKFKKHVTANNSPGTPTADANWSGWINWGGAISRRVGLHEIAHTLGIGTYTKWQANITDGKWTGKHALKQLQEFDGPKAELHADHMHFWPYGLNFDNESSPVNDLRFLKMVAAMRKDMGIE